MAGTKLGAILGSLLIIAGTICIIVGAILPQFLFANDYDNHDLTFKLGAWRVYLGDEYKEIDSDCQINFDQSILGFDFHKSFNLLDNCRQFNAFRALMVLSIIFGAIASIISLITLCVAPAPKSAVTAFVFALIGSLMGMISMALFADQFHDKKDNFDTSFGLLTGGWSAMFLGAFGYIFSSQAEKHNPLDYSLFQ
jgi:hypothetical protein